MTSQEIVNAIVSKYAVDKKVYMDYRYDKIGGSEIAILVGESKWASPLDLYMRKKNKVETPASIPMRRGNMLEPLCIELYQEHHPEMRIVNTTFFDSDTLEEQVVWLRTPKYPAIAASLDRIAIDDNDKIGIIEAKSAVGYGTEKFKLGLPSYYELQGNLYAGILMEILKTEYPNYFDSHPDVFIHYPVYIDDRYEEYVTTFDADKFKICNDAASDFKENYLDKNVLPDYHSLDDYKAYYKEAVKDKEFELSDDFFKLFATKLKLERQVKDYKEKVLAQVQGFDAMDDDFKFLCYKICTDAEYITYKGERIASFKYNKNNQRSLRVDHKAIEKLSS